MMDAMYSAMLGGMKQGIEASVKGKTLNPAQQKIFDALPDKMMAVLKSEMSWEKLEPTFRQVYKETFTQSEVDAMVAFYKTPAGVAMIDKTPAMMAKVQDAMRPIIPQVMEKMDKVVKDEGMKMKAASDGTGSGK
jgi:hypothetical protein